MNNVRLEIMQNGVWTDFTKRLYAPYKYGDFLDEQLEEGLIALKRCRTEFFYPLTLVKITQINFPECKITARKMAEIQARANDDNITYSLVDNRLKEEKTRYYFIASDNSYESPVGTDKYTHEIYLIELTKIAEGYIGDSLTFTNALGNIYTE